MFGEYFFVLSILFGMTKAVELTFELPDSAKECFFEIIQEGTESTVEYQVRIPFKRRCSNFYSFSTNVYTIHIFLIGSDGGPLRC